MVKINFFFGTHQRISFTSTLRISRGTPQTVLCVHWKKKLYTIYSRKTLQTHWLFFPTKPPIQVNYSHWSFYRCLFSNFEKKTTEKKISTNCCVNIYSFSLRLLLKELFFRRREFFKVAGINYFWILNLSVNFMKKEKINFSNEVVNYFLNVFFNK